MGLVTAPLPAPKTGITRTSLYRYFPPAQPNRSPQDNRPSGCRTPLAEDPAQLHLRPHDRALVKVMTALIKDDAEIFRQFSDNEGFKRWLSDSIFNSTYKDSA